MDGEKDQILVLAGDIALPDITLRMEAFLTEVCERFAIVFYALGNHEYYSSSIRKTHQWARRLVNQFDNLIFANDDCYTFEGTKIFGGTLWTDCNNSNPVDMLNIARGMNDYYQIQNFDVHKGIKRHKNTVAAIKKCKPDVIITHHAPSYKSIHPYYSKNNLNPAYCSNLEPLIMELQPKLWIHGHTHTSFNYLIGGTRVVCNPRGYYDENCSFSDTLVIEL
jgi:predicted phosphohydrolase